MSNEQPTLVQLCIDAYNAVYDFNEALRASSSAVQLRMDDMCNIIDYRRFWGWAIVDTPKSKLLLVDYGGDGDDCICSVSYEGAKIVSEDDNYCLVAAFDMGVPVLVILPRVENKIRYISRRDYLVVSIDLDDQTAVLYDKTGKEESRAEGVVNLGGYCRDGDTRFYSVYPIVEDTCETYREFWVVSD